MLPTIWTINCVSAIPLPPPLIELTRPLISTAEMLVWPDGLGAARAMSEEPTADA